MDGQVQTPASASGRLGIQPTIDITNNASAKVSSKVGKPVSFTSIVELPPNSGELIAVEWDFEGKGTFPVKNQIEDSERKTKIITKESYTFKTPGTYFITVRVTSQRKDAKNTPYALIKNLGRTRIIVE